MRINKSYRLLSVVILSVLSASLWAQQKATYVLVHGAWGGSWAFKQTDSLLRAKGHTVYRIQLTGQGERVHLASPEIDLNTHILDVVNTILFDKLENVVLVGHSYGGMVITGVADTIPGRIKQLIYLDAFIPENGESAVTARKDGQSGPERESENGFVVPRWVGKDAPVPKDVPQSLKTFTTPVSWKNPQAKRIAATYILTVDPGKKPEEDFFFYFAERAKKRNWKVVNMTADHNPQMTNPTGLATLLDKERL